MAPSADFLPRTSSPESTGALKFEEWLLMNLLRTSTPSLHMVSKGCIYLTIREGGVFSVVENRC